MRSASDSLHAGGDVLAQLVERVEARRVGGEVVVQLGELLLAHVLDGDLELRVLARQVLGLVVVREGHGDRALLAGAHADELLLEAGDEPAGAQLDHLVAALAALEGHVVDRAEVVHDEVVALGGPALDGLELGLALAQRLDLGVDVLVAGRRLAPLDLDALVGAEGRHGAHADLDAELQRLALGGQVAQVDVGVADGDDVRRVDGLRVPAAERGADRLVQHGQAAHPLDDDRRGNLPLAEPGHLQVAAQGAGGGVDAGLDLGGLDLGIHANAGFGEFGNGGGDVRHGPATVAWPCALPPSHPGRARPRPPGDRSRGTPVRRGLVDWVALAGRVAWAKVRGRPLW